MNQNQCSFVSFAFTDANVYTWSNVTHLYNLTALLGALWLVFKLKTLILLTVHQGNKHKQKSVIHQSSSTGIDPQKRHEVSTQTNELALSCPYTSMPPSSQKNKIRFYVLYNLH